MLRVIPAKDIAGKEAQCGGGATAGAPKSDRFGNVPPVVKIDVGAVQKLLDGTRQGRRYIRAMAAFTLDGETYEYLKPDPGHPPEEARSWEYGNYPKVLATLPLANGDTVTVYAVAERWNPSHILVSWADDGRHSHWAWIPAGNVERVTDSDWDIWQYHRCPENLRSIRWGDRLPGFLPA